MHLYHLQIALAGRATIMPVQLTGAFYALLDWINPAQAKRIHDLDQPKMSLYFDTESSMLTAGFCGEEWPEIFADAPFEGAIWKFGDQNLKILKASFEPAKPVPQKKFYTISSLSPLILRHSDRSPNLNPSIQQILGSACRKVSIKLPLEFVESLDFEINGQHLRCDYLYQSEPAFWGQIMLHAGTLPESQAQSLQTALTALNVMGAGAKTAMGFGKVQVS